MVTRELTNKSVKQKVNTLKSYTSTNILRFFFFEFDVKFIQTKNCFTITVTEMLKQKALKEEHSHSIKLWIWSKKG